MTINKLTNMSVYNPCYVNYDVNTNMPSDRPRCPHIALFSVGGRVLGVDGYCAIVGHSRSVLAVFLRRLAKSSQGSRCSG